MNKKTRGIAALMIAAAMLAPAAASAAEWISLNAWSYNAVSGFISDGLLPESFAGISDYKRVINRGEFCELIYSVLEKTGMVMREFTMQFYEDCGEYPSVDRLFAMDAWTSGRLMADNVLLGDYDKDAHLFYPEQPVTRAWAAETVQSVLGIVGIYDKYFEKVSDSDKSRIAEQIKDYYDIQDSDPILVLIRDGLMSDMDDGCFHANYSMTVEQAVVLAYRMYKAIPRAVTNDNEGEETERNIGAGLTELITKDYYVLQANGETVMQLETDVYSKLLAADHNGRKLIFAVNFNDKTDVFDTETKELIYTIPYIVNELDEKNGYAFTISSRFMPSYTGLYSMENRELIKPEYSRREVSQLIENDFQLPKEEYRKADGWIYYSNWNDSGHLYKIDTNGENKQCLVDNLDCTAFSVIGDTIYFRENGTFALHSVKTDGTERRDLTQRAGGLGYASYMGLDPYDYGENAVYGKDYLGFDTVRAYDTPDWTGKEYSDVYADGSVLICESVEGALVHEDLKGRQETRAGWIYYRLTPQGEKTRLANFCAEDLICSYERDGKIYFVNAEQMFTTGQSPIYVNDNGELRCVSGDYKSVCFGFLYRPGAEKLDYDHLAFIAPDEILKGTYHIIDLKTGEITQEKFLPQKEDKDDFFDEAGRHLFEECSNEELTVFGKRKADDEESWSRDSALYVEYKGAETLIGDSAVPVNLEGIWLYYADGGNGSLRTGNDYYSRIADGSGTLLRYNYITGERQTVDSGFNTLWSLSDSWILYQTTIGSLNISMNDQNALAAFPCKGFYRYGKPESICHMPRFAGQKRYLYKIDDKGNICRLTDTDSENAVCVLNDGSELYIDRL